MSVGTITISIFILGLFSLLFLNLNEFLSKWNRQVQLIVYLKDDITKSQGKAIVDIIKNSKIEESIAKLHPLKRIGEGADAANLANFLLSKNSSWITGQIIGVDGGRAAIA